MAKTKAYSVVREFGIRTTDGEVVLVRHDSDMAGKTFPPSKMREHVEAGNLIEYDAELGSPSEGVTAETAEEQANESKRRKAGS